MLATNTEVTISHFHGRVVVLFFDSFGLERNSIEAPDPFTALLKALCEQEGV